MEESKIVSETQNPICILHLEDDQTDAELIQLKLERANISSKITWAKNAEEFKNALQTAQFDVILADYKLPDYDGLSAMRLVKEKYADTPFIFVSGTMGEEFAIQALTEGGADYVLKQKLDRLAPAIKRELNFAETARQRKIAEEKLLNSEARFRRLFESAKDGILILNAETGEIIDINPFLVEMLGYSYNNFLGKKLWEIGLFKDIAANQDKLAELQQKEYIRYENLPLKTFDGRSIEVEVIANVYSVKDHKLIQCSIRDISERKEAARALASSQKLLKEIVDNSKLLIYITDKEGKFKLLNKGLELLFNLQEGEMIGRKRNDFMPAEIAESHYANDLKVFDSGTALTIEELNHEVDGNHTYLSTKFPLLDSNGKIYAVCGISTDITERKRDEEKIKQLSVAIEQSPIVIIITNLDRDIQYVNKQFTISTGFGYDEAVGKNINILKSEYTSAEEYGIIWKTISGGNDWHGIFENKKNDGSIFWESATISPIKNDQGVITNYIAFKEDITERVKIEEEIKKNQLYTRSMIEASLDSLFTINVDGKLIDVNEAFIKSTGINRDELLNTDFSNYFTETEKAKAIQKEAFEKGFVRDYQLIIINKNESMTEVLLNASVYKDDKDNMIGVFIAARDMSAQKLALQYARRLIEASIDPLMTINEDGKITDINFATVKILGAPRADIIGTDFANYFVDPEKARTSYRLAFEKGLVVDYPLIIKDIKGKLTDVSLNASVYRNEKGKVLGVFADARDISAQKVIAEKTMAERKKELAGIEELEKFRTLFIERELKIIELEKQIKELKN